MVVNIRLLGAYNAVKKNPTWQQCSRWVVYENPWIRVSHDKVLTPAQTEGI